MDPALQQELRSGRGDDMLEAIVKLRDPAKTPAGLRAVSRFGSIATVRLRRGDARRVWMSDDVLSLKAARLLEFGEAPAGFNLPLPTDIRRPPGIRETGAGVVIGIIDWGIDFASAALRDAKGGTRLLGLWDQRGKAADKVAEYYGYGRTFDRVAIDKALRSPTPYAALGYHPGTADPLRDGSHGHHVADIIAGNGAAGGPSGLAPEADIVFVHLAAGDLGGLANLGDSVRILEALDFIRSAAGKRPLVVNTSLGRHGGDHRGVSLLEQAFDTFVAEEPGRAIAMSAGNYHASKTHAAGRLVPGRSRTLRWIVHPGDRTPNELELWYPSDDRFGLTVAPPGGTPIEVPLGSNKPIVIGGRETGRIYHRQDDPNAHDHHIDIFLTSHAPAGEWRVTIRGEAVVDGRYDAWIERDAGGRHQSRFADADVAAPSSTGSICNGFRTIACGAYDARRPPLLLGAFSSGGPTRDGRWKPDILAPGVAILAGRSTPAGSAKPVHGLTRKSGTSQAAPHVAGALCLMFEAAGRTLTIDETRIALLASARPHPDDFIDHHRGGAGILDIPAAIDAARAAGGTGSKGGRAMRSSDSGFAPASEALSASIYDALTGSESAGVAGGYAMVGWADSVDPSALESGDLLIRRAFGEGGVAECRSARERSAARGYGGRQRRDAIVVRPMHGVDFGETAPSDYVRWVQGALNMLTGAGLQVDGISGPKTREAVRGFQAREGLVPDGVVGPKTDGALRQALQARGGGGETPHGLLPTPRGGGGGGIPTRCMGIKQRELIVPFEFGSDKVTPKHELTLINIAHCLIASRKSATPITAITMIGHTDPVGGDAENVALGLRRAESTKAALLARLKLMTGATFPLVVATESRGEREPAADAEQSRRVEIIFPHAFPLAAPKPEPKPPEPKPVPPPPPPPSHKTATFEMTSKSVILPVGADVGVILRCLIDPLSAGKLLAFGLMLDQSVNDSCETDQKDQNYRLFADFDIDVVHDGTKILASALKGPTTDVGLECFPIIKKGCLTPPDVTVVQNKLTRVSDTRVDFVWEVKGRPHVLAEQAFIQICPRTSKFIWHHVKGSIEMAGGAPAVKASIVGSAFPTHCLFLNGKQIDFVRQGKLARLWDAHPSDPSLVN